MNCDINDIRQRYDEQAETYDKTIGIVDRLGGIGKLRREFLQRSKGNVLAVAIGTGIDLPFYPKSCNMTGIDVSEEMLAIARKRADRLHTGIDLQSMDAENLSFPDESFDTVTSTLALCTYPRPIETLREMARVCKPDGRLLFIEHGRSSSAVVRSLRWLFAARNLRKHGCHLLRDIVRLVSDAELQVIDHRRALFGIFHGMEARK